MDTVGLVTPLILDLLSGRLNTTKKTSEYHIKKIVPKNVQSLADT